MQSYYSSYYSPVRNPPEMDEYEYEINRKNFSNPKVIGKTKLITKKTYLDGEKIKERRNYNLYQSGHGSTQNILQEYREEVDDQPYEVIRNQPQTERYEEIEKIEDCNNYDNYQDCGNYDDYGNCKEYIKYSDCRDYDNSYGNCKRFETYDSYNDCYRNCRDLKSLGRCKKLICFEVDDCDGEYKKCRDCGNSKNYNYEYIEKRKNYNNYGNPKNYQDNRIYKNYENYRNYVDYGNRDGNYKYTTVKREVIHKPTQVIRSQPKIKKYKDYESYQVDTETRDEDEFNEVKKIESLVDNYKYKETKEIYDPRMKSLVIHKRKCSPTTQVKYLVNSGRNVRNNKSSKMYENRRPINPPQPQPSLSFCNNRSTKYVIPNTKKVYKEVKKSYVLPPIKKEVIEETIGNYELTDDKNNYEVAEDGSQTHYPNEQYIVKTKNVTKTENENIVEDDNCNIMEVNPEEKVYTTKYIIKKNIYEEEESK